MDECAAFWARIKETQGPAVASMLRSKPAPEGAPRRGLFLGRMATERSELLEKRMSSAAKGDNTYYFWGMSGRILVDLMQVIKDDKKPDDATTATQVADFYRAQKLNTAGGAGRGDDDEE
jgi:hypothetical protein